MSSKEPQPAASSDDRSATVFVIDDDHGVRDSIRNLVWSIGLGVELFSSADEFLARGEWPRPACLVLDVRLPGQNGLEFQHYLTRAHVSIPIVFISGYADVPMSVRAMKAGAVEFIIKPVRPQDLLDAIQSAIARDLASLRQAASIAGLRAKLSTLSVREREVLDLIVTGLANKQIAAALGITDATVKLHRGNVMRKMHAKSVAELVNMAHELSIA
jgi:FixJ family two-component response regulator